MNSTSPDARAAAIAGAIGDPARARMLYNLVDGVARTSTELAAIAGITPSTASVHLQRLKEHALVKVVPQGKHRYYTLGGPQVASALEALSVVAGGERTSFVPGTPHYLRAARMCYDHLAGALGVALHDALFTSGWLTADTIEGSSYAITGAGRTGLAAMGIDVDAVAGRRRRFAFGCLDWSERRPHLGGALAAALLEQALRRRWISREPGSRALAVTSAGRREMARRLNIKPAAI